MALNKVRYVTVCQQFLTTAVVLVTGVTAAGVLTLDIAAPQPGVQAQQWPQGQPGTEAQVRHRAPSEVNVRPVQPKVREVSVGSLPKPAKTERRAPEVAPETAPEATPEKTLSEEPAIRDGVSPRRTIVAVSEPEKVTGFATVGVTWKAGSPVSEDDLQIEFRTRDEGRWSGWDKATFSDEHGPDAPEAAVGRVVRPGTDALVVGDVDEVQMRATSLTGQAPRDVNLAIIDPGVGKQVEEAPAIDTAELASAHVQDPVPETTDPVPTSEGPVDLAGALSAPKPYIYSRAQWGANEKLRDGSPRYGTIKAGFVHHTVNANNYSASDVPALIRGIYAYHTRSRGWSDIGYNFLVDRFGRIWEGRAGGVDKAVIGAHTRGYNEYSFAMSAIGNFDIASPPQAVLTAYAKLFAWKLSLYNIPADRTRIYIKNKYFNAINGHRDAGSTACPGKYLYARLPAIRTAARALQNGKPAPTPTPTPAPGYQPTLTPTAAVAQPGTLAFPANFSLTGSRAPDIVAAQGGTLKVYRSTGRATGFLGAKVMGPEWNELAGRSVVGDLNRDGLPDMIVRKRNGSARIVTVTRSGRTATIRHTGTTAFKYYNLSAGMGDMTGDRKADVIARHYGTRKLMLFRGLGNGRFARPTVLSNTVARDARMMWTAGNVVGDWRPDMIFQTGSGALYAVPGKRNGVGAPVRLPVIPGASFLGVGNLDAAGGRDLVFARGNFLYALPGTGRGFSRSVFGPVPAPAGLSRRVVYNVGGSGHADLIGFDRNARPVVSLHNGQRAFSSVITAATRIQTPMSVMSVGDWNNDGHNDVITRHGANGDRLILRPGRGNGTLAAGVPMSSGWKSITALAALGDVTGDGNPDLVGRIGTSAMRIWPGDGKQGFLPPRWANRYMKTFGRLGTGTWRTFEGSDTIISSRDGNFVPVGGPPSTASARARVVSPGTDIVVGVGDMSGDGAADLVTRDPAGNLWLLRGARTYAGAVTDRIYLGNGFGGYSALG